MVFELLSFRDGGYYKMVGMEKVDKILSCYPKGESSLIEALHAVQEEIGYLPIEVQERIAETLRVPTSAVYGVVTFYNFFRMKPVGKHVITICDGTACHIKGSMKLVDVLREELNFKEIGETMEGDMFTVQLARCFGACGLAPVINIDGKVYGKMTPTKLKSVLRMYKEGYGSGR